MAHTTRRDLRGFGILGELGYFSHSGPRCAVLPAQTKTTFLAQAAAPRESAGMSVPEGDVNALENRLATHAVYDDGNKRLLEQLLTGNEELRKNNASLELENQRLQHTLDLDLRRHKEVAKTDHFSDMYDWIVNIELLSDVSKEVGHFTPPAALRPRVFPLAACPPRPAPRPPRVRPPPLPERVVRRRAQGWRIEFSQTFLQGLDATQREHLLSGKAWSTSDGKGKPEVTRLRTPLPRGGGRACYTQAVQSHASRPVPRATGHRLARRCRGGAWSL